MIKSKFKRNKKNCKIEEIADCFLRIVDRDSGSTITPLKLQKILYYAQQNILQYSVVAKGI